MGDGVPSSVYAADPSREGPAPTRDRGMLLSYGESMQRPVTNPTSSFRSNPSTQVMEPVYTGAPSRRRRPAWLWVLLILALFLALLLSNCAGFLASSLMRPEVIAQQQTQQELDEALALVDQSATERSEAVAAAEQLDVQVAELQDRIAELELQAEGHGSEVEEAAAALLAVQEERDAALGDVDRLEDRVAALEAELEAARADAPAPRPAPAAAPAPRPAPVAATPSSPSGGSSTSGSSTSGTASGTSSGSVYYANCSAVRAAGRAPLYANQAGYRSGLDRDGDGVACE
ncbi:Excalibur calcium-binding domain-containing protein [Agrococcus carbonis]|uniref:Excalibur calcium-binding domain-containing protein n=1 Tax=Agrococcus carbonis TaxID=684552 RepID=A0A1H1PXP2_9MICO|nr:Excalibur calcium-binding domain-containing protein [Agrococcus carbonis]